MTRPNATFQQWQALLTNRRKRSQTQTFLVHGVRPIEAALGNGLEIDTVIVRSGEISEWAEDIVRNVTARRKVEISPELMHELDERNDTVAEILLVAIPPERLLNAISLSGLASSFIVVLDRPQNPGNVGTAARSADALGAGMVVVTGHAADVYDPKCVRASRGSIFALPVAQAESAPEVLAWMARETRDSFQVLGLSEDGDTPLWECDLMQPTLAIVGNETVGVSRQWREASTVTAAIPMSGRASSLNAASSASITLYEFARQRAGQVVGG